MSGSYTAVLFDLDGTLLDFHACEVNSLKKALASVGIGFEGGLTWASLWETYAPLKSYHWRKRGAGEINREQAIENAIRDTLRALNLDESLASPISENYMRAFVQAGYVQPGAHETLGWLKGRVALGMVTNGYQDAQRGRAEAARLVPYFDAIIVSEAVGLEKPDPRIFHLALSQLGLRPSEAIYVGDSIEFDYKGALSAGIDFCHYDPKGFRPELDPEPALRILTLQELTRYLSSD